MYASLLFLSQSRFLAGARLLPASALRSFATAASLRGGSAAALDDEESVPENVREDRALNIA